MTAVSFVVPVHNGAAHVTQTLASIAAQADGRPIEIIVVEDRSDDGSAALLQELAAVYPLEIVEGPGRGAAAAVNAGIRLASHPIICQVDQDVVLEPGWLTALVAALQDPSIAAAQGCYVTDAAASFFARVTSLDLEHRYARMGARVDHVCTGNTAYRASALHAVGLADETLGYGYDNDLSYRLQTAGYRLVFCPEARSHHRWREGLMGYLAQQYGFGYGRLDVVARHPRRWTGDTVSPIGMMAHPVVTCLALGLLAAAVISALIWGEDARLAALGASLLLLLAAERFVSGVRAWKQFGNPVGLAFPLVHFARDVAWVAAIAMWSARRLLRRPPAPAHSMPGRAAAR